LVNTSNPLRTNSHARASSQITLGEKRRIHTNGVAVLENKYGIHDGNRKLITIENRIKRLQFEEERADKMAA
jgi:hypothetical protein